MSNAQAMHKSLVSAGMSSDEAWEIINDKFAAKVDEPIDENVLKAAQAAVEDVFGKGGDDTGMGGEPVNGQSPAESIEKSEEVESHEATDNSDYDIVAIVSKGADEILESTERQNKVLAKGYMTLSTVTDSLAKSANAQAEKLSEIESKIDALTKSMNVEVPPRSIVAEHVQVIEKPGQVQKSEGITRERVLTKANTEIRETKDLNRRFNLVSAVAELDSGADPAVTAAKYHLDVQ